jgi:invasion protein IalB
MIRRRFAAFFFSVSFCTWVATADLVSSAYAASAEANVLGEFGAWVATQVSESGKPVCYISTRPTKDEGDYTKRGDIFAIVTHRPAEKSIGVVSFRAGYPIKSDVPVTVSIDDKTNFSLFSQGEYAWTRESGDDKALVGAMRAGIHMVVKGTSQRGTLTTDTYDLTGFSAAMDAINKACGVQ